MPAQSHETQGKEQGSGAKENHVKELLTLDLNPSAPIHLMCVLG